MKGQLMSFRLDTHTRRTPSIYNKQTDRPTRWWRQPKDECRAIIQRIESKTKESKVHGVEWDCDAWGGWNCRRGE